jgi:hypothetical protein
MKPLTSSTIATSSVIPCRVSSPSTWKYQPAERTAIERYDAIEYLCTFQNGGRPEVRVAVRVVRIDRGHADHGFNR